MPHERTLTIERTYESDEDAIAAAVRILLRSDDAQTAGEAA